MAREHWIDLGAWGVMIAAAQPWHVFNTRDRRASVDRNSQPNPRIMNNRYTPSIESSPPHRAWRQFVVRQEER